MSADAQAPDLGLKPATPITCAHNRSVLGSLPFGDRADFEDARRGFIGTLPKVEFRNAEGRVIYSLEDYAFLDEEQAPDTVNPSLWRQARLNMANGLFEVTEDASPTSEGARYSFTPELGLFHAVTGLHGDIMIPEDRLKAAVVKSAIGDLPLLAEIDKLLGKAWDESLEPFRHAGEGAPVRWLHHVV